MNENNSLCGGGEISLKPSLSAITPQDINKNNSLVGLREPVCDHGCEPVCASISEPVASMDRPSRPVRHSRQIKLDACAELLIECADWGNWNPLITAEMLVSHDSLDGYEFARNLENAYLVDPDRELVEILDGYWSLLSRWHEAAVKAWVKEHNVTAPEWLKPDARVVSTGTANDGRAGAVVEYRHETAEVCVRLDEDADDQLNRRHIYPVECVKLAEVGNG